MKKGRKIALIIFGILTAMFIPVYLIFLPNPTKDGWSGLIVTNTTWEDEVYVTGDIIVAPWATLTIMPGTIITIRVGEDDFNFISAHEPDDLQQGDPTVDPDAGANDYLKTHISITGFGKIISKGTAEKPITFTSEKETPDYADWCGIYVKNAEFEYTSVLWSVDGIFASWDFEKLTVDHCYIAHSFACGVGFGSAKNIESIAYVKHSTIEDCGHEAIDTHSSGDIEIAYNDIDSCQVGFNIRNDGELGSINANIHHNIITNTGSPILIHRAKADVSHCVLQQSFQDTSRWIYGGWQMVALEDLGCINLDPAGYADVFVKNSIILNSPTGFKDQEEDQGTSSCVSDYNNFDNVAIDFEGAAVSAGASNTYISSLFVDVANRDFHLQPGSPLKGAGDPADGLPDLGVYGGDLAEEEIGWAPS